MSKLSRQHFSEPLVCRVTFKKETSGNTVKEQVAEIYDSLRIVSLFAKQTNTVIVDDLYCRT